MSIKSDISWRVYLSFILLTGFSIAVIGKIVQTQNMEGKYWRSVADSLSTAYKEIDADRGNIYSEDGRMLATSLPFFEIRMNTQAPWLTDSVFYKNIDSLACQLANLIQDTTAEVYRKLYPAFSNTEICYG
jgi:cell division protein FtsI (penicillin-binding protein 3)